MTIHTDITADDFKMFSRHVAIGVNRRRQMYPLVIGSGVVVGVILGVTLAVSRFALHVPSLMAGICGGTFWLWLFSRLYVRKLARAADSCIFGPRTISVTEDGVVEKSEKCETLFRWPAIRSVDLVGDYIFIMLERHVGMIVPCRAFSSNVEREQFLAEVRSRMTQGKK